MKKYFRYAQAIVEVLEFAHKKYEEVTGEFSPAPDLTNLITFEQIQEDLEKQ